MTLATGARLGPYEIVSALGAGGMSACGHAEPRTGKSEAWHQRKNALGGLVFAASEDGSARFWIRSLSLDTSVCRGGRPLSDQREHGNVPADLHHPELETQ